MEPIEIRDSKGKLVAYNSKKPGCVYGEVLAIKIEKRMERIESNIGDARIEIQKLVSDIDHIKSQVSGVCSLTRELTNEVRTYAKIQTEANHEKRIQKLEKQITVTERIAKIGTVIIGMVCTIAGAIFGFLKITGDK